MPTTTIKGCDDCPFQGLNWCNLERRFIGRPSIDGLPFRNHEDKPHPDWCPLLREPITVTLLKD